MPKPKRQRQTRLTFTPLPSSSPAPYRYPDQMKDRAAAVRYDNHGRSNKKRRLGSILGSQTSFDSSSSSIILSSPKVVIESPPKVELQSSQSIVSKKAALPTPVASFQVANVGKPKNKTPIAKILSSSEDDEVLTPIPRKLFSGPVKTKQAGNNVFSDFSSSPSVKKVKADPRYASITPARRRPGVITSGRSNLEEGEHDHVVISSSDDESDDLRKRAAFQSTPKNLARMQTPPQTEEEPTRQGRPCRLNSRSSTKELSSMKRKRSIESPTKTQSSGPLPSTPSRLQRLGSDRFDLTMTKITTLMSPKERREGTAAEIQDGNEATSEDSDEILSPIRRTKPIKSSNMAFGDSDDIQGPAVTPRRKGRPKIVQISDDAESESSSDIVPTSSVRKGRLRRASEVAEAKSSSSENESDDDIREDLEDLRDTEVRKTRTRGTQRTPKKTKAQEQLEIIKRRRAGETIPRINDSPSEEDTPARNKRALYDTTPSTSSTSEASEQEEEPPDQPIRRGENLDTYDDDFVIEDDSADADVTLGVPTDMPFEFTRHAHKKPIEHFRDAVEWMVHNKLNPAFPRDDASYQVAFRKLDDEVQGLAGSKFTSAAWGGEFLKALKTRPEMIQLENEGGMADLQHCAACNRSNHPAKFQLVFSGRPYDRRTLESLESDDEDEDEEEQEIFHVGRTCCANAETAHALYHWRYALNYWVLKFLREQGHTAAKEIVKREQWSTKRKSEYANSIVDGMEESGDMRQLYKEFKENLQAARDARNDKYSYGRKPRR